MQHVGNFDGEIRKGLEASLALVRRLDVSGLDVVQVDVENFGASAMTGLQVLGRVSAGGPLRDITPPSWTTPSTLLWSPAAANLALLAPGANAQVGLNVTALYEIEIYASGVGAVLALNAGGYKVQP